jgi:hypothetical protein
MKRSAAFSLYPVTAFGGSMLCVAVPGTINAAAASASGREGGRRGERAHREEGNDDEKKSLRRSAHR